MVDSSKLSFYKLPVSERSRVLKDECGLTDADLKVLHDSGALSLEVADKMIENVVGVTHLPFGVAANFKVNGKDYAVPMAVEEPSVVAGASYIAKLARETGGFLASADEPLMMGQIQIVGFADHAQATNAAGQIQAHKPALLESLKTVDSMLVKLGGGPRDVETRVVKGERGWMVIVHLVVNVLDAMGANAVNTMSESIAPKLEELATPGKIRLKIITNLATKRLARARMCISKESLAREGLTGEQVVNAVLDAYDFALHDPFRCATNNKGIMNGIDAVCVATGNDWRAVEAGAHAYSAWKAKENGHSSALIPLAKYYANKNGDLCGEIELPLAVATIGGSIRSNPLAQLSLKMLGVKSAKELAEVIAAVGLAQNFAAVRALATEGIQRGHMGLHARNVAMTAGATGEMVDTIAAKMKDERNVRLERAKELLDELSKKS